MHRTMMLTVAGGALALASVSPLSAQEGPLPPVAPPVSPGGYVAPRLAVPEGVSVADRPRPEYLPIGGRLGSFFLYPTVELTWRHTDNLRATDTNRLTDDAAKLAATAQIVSGFSRHSLRAGAWYDRTFHAQNPSENASRYGGTVAARLDLPATGVDLGFTAERNVVNREDYNSPNNARNPLAYDRLHGNLGVTHTFNRLTIASSGSVTRLKYRDVLDDNGALLDQRYRDLTGVGARMEVTWSARPGVALLGRTTYSQFSYALPASDPAQPGGLDRDSHGWQAEGGVRLELTHVLYGEIRAGYLTRTYDDPRLRNARGVSFGADVLWNPTGRTSLRLSADHRIEEAASTQAAGNRVTDLGLAVEQEVRRNLLLTANVRHVRYSPLGPVPPSSEWHAAVGARAQLNRRYSVRIDYRYETRDSPDPLHAYRENLLTIGFKAAF